MNCGNVCHIYLPNECTELDNYLCCSLFSGQGLKVNLKIQEKNMAVRRRRSVFISIAYTTNIIIDIDKRSSLIRLYNKHQAKRKAV